MKNLSTHKKILLIIATHFALLPFIVSAQTPPPGNLIVEFQSQPLFQELNFLPGDSVTRWIKVTNNTLAAEDIIVDAINVSDPDNLGSAFSLIIKEGATTVYSGTLGGLFSAGEVLLSNVPSNGGQFQYYFSAQFLGPSGDEFQEKSLGFDLLVGFSGGTVDGPGETPVTIVTTSIGGEGGGGFGGGNGPITPNGLSIFNESTLTGTTENDSVAVVTWDTNYPSTSRVIYGTAPGVFNYNNPPNYGYEFSTPEFNTPAGTNGVVHHVVTLVGLVPDVTYYYRVISTASPPTISYEKTFVAKKVDDNKQNTSGTNNSFTYVGGDSTALATGSWGELLGRISNDVEIIPNGYGSEGTSTQSTTSSSVVSAPSRIVNNGESTGESQLAQVSSGDSGIWWWLLLILILVLLFVLWFISRNKSQQ